MENKKCTKCNECKPLSEFHNLGKRYNSWCKSCLYKTQILRWRDRKRKAVELMGGKCKICGYDKNLCSLDFHHVDSKTKDYEWTKLRQMGWQRIIEELKKCIIVCRNCHGEIHWPDQSLIRDEMIDNALLNNVLVPTGKCPKCEKDVYGTKFCSLECASFSRRRADRPRKDQLRNMMTRMSWRDIGKKYNVSDSAVIKWAKAYDLF